MRRSLVAELREGRPLVGTWAQLRCPEVIDLLGVTHSEF